MPQGKRPGKRPLGDIKIVRRWLVWLEAQGVGSRTLSIYRSAVGRFLFEKLGDSPQSATRTDVTEFLAEVGQQGPSGRRQAAQALRSLYGFLVLEKLIAEDPTEGLRVRKPKARPQVALRAEELVRILYAAYWRGGEKRMAALAFALGTGCRRTELAHVAPADVVGEAVHLRVCKGGKDRWVPLSPLAKVALEILAPWYNGTILGGVKVGTLSDWAQEAAKDAGLYEKVRGRPLHVMRASYATHLLNSGTPIHVVQKMLGHESVATTGVYAVPFEEQPEQAARGLVFT